MKIPARIILSRKSFDSGCGGIPSPIMPDGTLLSLPIPTEDGIPYAQLTWNGMTYEKIIRDLRGCIEAGGRILNAHLDPDLSRPIYLRQEGWRGIFGQCGAAQSHLESQGVGVGDLFLFFGWFRQVEAGFDGRWRYIKGTPDLHVIYGYLQIGEIFHPYKREQLRPWMKYHSHCNEEDGRDRFYEPGNTVYLATEHLMGTARPGYGTFRLNDNNRSALVLTADGLSRSRWRLQDWMCSLEVSISYHTSAAIKKAWFESTKRGQEFVITPASHPMVGNWLHGFEDAIDD